VKPKSGIAVTDSSAKRESSGGEKFIPLYRPDLSGNERRYVLECLDSTWISSNGAFVGRFEAEFARAVGVAHAVTVSNGTVALHLALHSQGIGPSDEVIVPTFSYISCVNTIVQTGAKPIFVDSRPSDWLMDPDDVESRITERTKAIMAVHLYGAVCEMDTLQKIASRHGLLLIEDCAEALGATLAGRQAGALGDVACFSFYGNKTVTTGEGGMVATQSAELAARLRLLKSQGQDPERRYWHTELGFNYRMTNICAAIGLAQIERLPAIVARKRAIADMYRDLLGDSPVTCQKPSPEVVSSNWLFSLLLPKGVERDHVAGFLADNGVETRPVFHCAHQMPMYLSREFFPHAEDISERGISLPSFPGLSDSDIDVIVGLLKASLRQ
jgi:perosamine synthetase